MKIARDIVKSSLFRVTSLNSVSVVLKIGIGLITSKIIAVFVGPSGLALVGNLRNFMSSLETISTFGVQNGVVKYVAENDKDDERLRQILSTLFLCLTAMSMFLAGVLFFLADYWNAIVFGTGFRYSFIFKALAVAMPFYASSIILISVINGLSRFKEVIYVTIAGNVLGLILSAVLILQLHTFGALLSIIITPSLLFFVSFYLVNRQVRLLRYISTAHFSFDFVKQMSGYSLMALVSSVISPLVYLLIRKNIIDKVGIAEAGHWEAITRISLYYLMFITTILVVYFLPKLVHAKSDSETNAVYRSYCLGIMPLFIFGLVVLFFLRDFVIGLLFTHEFSRVSDLFFWQLAGDILKGFSLILGYNLVAKKKTVVFIVSEIISVVTMYVSSYWLVSLYGIEGVVMAHFVTYFVYLTVLSVHSRKIKS